MANRQFTQFRLSLEKQVVELFAHVTFGSSGAPTLDTATSKGITSITRNSAGLYTIVLQDTYVKLLGVDLSQLSGSSAQAAPFHTVVSQAVSTAATRTVVIQYRAVNNSTATDPASGEQAFVRITVGNTSAF